MGALPGTRMPFGIVFKQSPEPRRGKSAMEELVKILLTHSNLLSSPIQGPRRFICASLLGATCDLTLVAMKRTRCLGVRGLESISARGSAQPGVQGWKSGS